VPPCGIIGSRPRVSIRRRHLRLFTLIRSRRPRTQSLIVSAACMAISHRSDVIVPTVSASNCMTGERPGPGFSLSHNGPAA